MRRFISILFSIAASLTAAASQAQDAQHQSLESVRTAAERFVRAQAAAQTPAALKVEIGALDARLRLAPCAAAPQAALPQGAQIGARMTIGVRCEQPSWTVYVPVTVQSEVPVLVARQALARNAPINAADVSRETRWVPGFAHLYVTDPAMLAGRHARQPIAPGTAITVAQLAADILVKRGQRVTLLAVAGGFEVRAAGEAVADSGAGGRVRVQNLGSMKIVEGVAESATLVRVY